MPYFQQLSYLNGLIFLSVYLIYLPGRVDIPPPSEISLQSHLSTIRVFALAEPTKSRYNTIQYQLFSFATHAFPKRFLTLMPLQDWCSFV